MADVIQSNVEVLVTKNFPNVLDGLTTTADRTNVLKRLYAGTGEDASYITDANSDSIYTKLNAHRLRVANDGGVVLSVPNTLRAIIFAIKNGIGATISAADWSAYSPDFGVKFVSVGSATITKVYDLSGRDMRISLGTFDRSTDGGFNVLKNTAASTMIAEGFFVGGQGMILGSSLHDADSGSSASQAVKGMYMSDNANSSGAGVGYLETNQGGTSRLYYKRASDSSMQNIGYDQTTNYKKYSGLVGYMSNSNNKVEIYENGLLKTTSTMAQIDLSAVNIYPTISAPALNSLLRESWLIRSTSQSLAIALSNHLNKSV
ncbi:hypothetical protein [Acinetobacter baumannii]|uniref:hypothetical protein n=1 Tax=Acinetobacter baumannii TaxID=470 RepID=UPI0034CD8C63